MSETYIVETTYGLKYTNKNAVPISEIIESLASLERVLLRSGKFLEKSYEGIHVTSTEVYITSLESGSLKEAFLIRYICGSKENFDDLSRVIKSMHEDSPMIKNIVAIGVGAVVAAGLYSLLPANSSAPNITAYNNTIINIGGQANLSSEDIKAVLDGFRDKKTLAKDAVGVVKPAKKDSSAEIEITGVEALNFSKELLSEAPEEYNPPIAEERMRAFSNIEVAIFASDRDKHESGWAGIVPSLFERRVRFSLNDGIDPKILHGRTNLRADIILHERFIQSKRRYEVKMVEITAVN